MLTKYIYLIIAIILEVISTGLLKASDGFTRFWPTLGSLVGFTITLYLLALTLKFIPVGIVYALWSGVGIVFITIIGLVVFKQSLDTMAYVGIAFIVIGVILIQLCSNSV